MTVESVCQRLDTPYPPLLVPPNVHKTSKRYEDPQDVRTTAYAVIQTCGMIRGMSIVDFDRVANARRQSRFRNAPGFELVVALSAATVLVGVAYILVPLWAAPDAWERASGPFQVVFAGMLAITGPAIGFFMAGARANR